MVDDADNNDREVARRLHAAIERELPTLGPHVVSEEGQPELVATAKLKEWVVVMFWDDPDGDYRYITRMGSEDLPRHHEVGLLHEILYEYDPD